MLLEVCGEVSTDGEAYEEPEAVGEGEDTAIVVDDDGPGENVACGEGAGDSSPLQPQSPIHSRVSSNTTWPAQGPDVATCCRHCMPQPQELLQLLHCVAEIPPSMPQALDAAEGVGATLGVMLGLHVTLGLLLLPPVGVGTGVK